MKVMAEPLFRASGIRSFLDMGGTERLTVEGLLFLMRRLPALEIACHLAGSSNGGFSPITVA